MQALLLNSLFVLALGSIGIVQGQTMRVDATPFDRPEGKVTAAALKAGTPIKLVQRQGFWVEVDAGGKTGWIKVSMVNFSMGAGGPTAIDTGRLGTGNIVATSAARGLSAKDLESGKPDFEQLGKLETLGASTDAVKSFLSQGNVRPAVGKVSLSAPSAVGAPAASGAGQSHASPVGRSQAEEKADDQW